MNRCNSIIFASLVAIAVATGCRKQDMADQPRGDPMEASKFFADGQVSRPLVIGTVPRGMKVVADPIYAVTTPGPEAKSLPFALSADDLERGRQRFNIYCAVCHGELGNADGMIVRRGFPKPPSFYIDRLRLAPVGHFYNVIKHGYGAMYSYAERVDEKDRWRIAGYIRALQASDPANTGLPTTAPSN